MTVFQLVTIGGPEWAEYHRNRRAQFVPVQLFVPLKLVSEANQREHWAAKVRRKMAQQLAVGYALLSARPAVLFPLLVTLTRVGGRKMDSDNLAGCFKHCQDAIAKYLGVDDGDERRVMWSYAQMPGGRCKGLSVRMEAR